MKKILFLLALFTITPMAFAQSDFAEIYQDTIIKRELNRQLEQAQIEEIHETLPPQAKKIYKKLTNQQRGFVDIAFLKAMQAKEEVANHNMPAHYTRANLMLFVAFFEDLYSMQLDYEPKAPVSLVITAALHEMEFETKDHAVFKISDFLQDYAKSFENLDQLTQGKLAIWSAQLTLDELELGL